MESQPQHAESNVPPGSPRTGVHSDLEDALGHHFSDPGLLEAALTHSSYVAEHAHATSYERLEFLGDAVLELAATDIIFSRMEDASEGEMTKTRASVVDVTSLSEIARMIRVGEHVRLGAGERNSGGADRDSILSDVVEALLGAVYLDAGFEAAAVVVGGLWSDQITTKIGGAEVTDPRSLLQEHLARTGDTVTFEYDRSGPDHDTVFTARAIVGGETVGEGSGGSKKAAALSASAQALATIGSR
ncbi:MAG: ribonuclease III [Acidimicrobiia bacterium]|nr:ribonuclease III [Acidimicrobiia bacterium]